MVNHVYTVTSPKPFIVHDGLLFKILQSILVNMEILYLVFNDINLIYVIKSYAKTTFSIFMCGGLACKTTTHNWLVMLSTDLATFCSIYSTNGPIWKCTDFLMYV